jgi:uncharacterized protein (DUF4415 family)
LELAFGESKEVYTMKKTKTQSSKRVKYTKGPDIDGAEFLGQGMPTIKELVKRRDTQKITIELDTEVVDFFKKQATTYGDKYQRLIRELLRQFVHKNT